jgi:hypothetical protein
MVYTGEMFAKIGLQGKLALSWQNDENWSAMPFSPIIYGLGSDMGPDDYD